MEYTYWRNTETGRCEELSSNIGFTDKQLWVQITVDEYRQWRKGNKQQDSMSVDIACQIERGVDSHR